MDQRPTKQVVTIIAIALTFCSGAMDVASFTRLGNVFASVMTGNIVLGGLALASHTAVAIAGYVVGVAAASRIAVGAAGRTPAGDDRGGAWPPHVTWALSAELALL